MAELATIATRSAASSSRYFSTANLMKPLASLYREIRRRPSSCMLIIDSSDHWYHDHAIWTANESILQSIKIASLKKDISWLEFGFYLQHNKTQTNSFLAHQLNKQFSNVCCLCNKLEYIFATTAHAPTTRDKQIARSLQWTLLISRAIWTILLLGHFVISIEIAIGIAFARFELHVVQALSCTHCCKSQATNFTLLYFLVHSR